MPSHTRSTPPSPEGVTPSVDPGGEQLGHLCRMWFQASISASSNRKLRKSLAARIVALIGDDEVAVVEHGKRETAVVVCRDLDPKNKDGFLLSVGPIYRM